MIDVRDALAVLRQVLSDARRTAEVCHDAAKTGPSTDWYDVAYFTGRAAGLRYAIDEVTLLQARLTEPDASALDEYGG